VQGVNDKEAVDFYLGKRIAYIYKVRWSNISCGAQTDKMFLRLRQPRRTRGFVLFGAKFAEHMAPMG
jgi:hypothetical protein